MHLSQVRHIQVRLIITEKSNAFVDSNVLTVYKYILALLTLVDKCSVTTNILGICNKVDLSMNDPSSDESHSIQATGHCYYIYVEVPMYVSTINV